MATDHWKNEFERVAAENRKLRRQLQAAEEAQVNLIAKWLWADVLCRQYKRDYLELRGKLGAATIIRESED